MSDESSRADALADLDLQLLLVFEAILDTGSVTASGRRLGRSQPAVSNALARLRGLLGDELFVREGNRMLPTPGALRMAPGVRGALDGLRRALREATRPDPAEAEEEIRIGTTDYGTALVVPRLMAILEKQAPRLRLRISQTTKARDLERLQEGVVDLLVGVYDDAPDAVRRRPLVRESFLVLGRGPGELTLDAYLERPHVLVSLADDSVGTIDEVLGGLQRNRRITTTVPHFLAAAWCATSSTALVTMPARLARRLAECHGLVAFEPPLELPGFTVDALWTERTHTDPLFHWFRARLREACDGL